MKTLHTIKIITFFTFCILINSCDSFVDVDLPDSQLTSITVFEDEATADAAMAHIYAEIRDNGLLSGTQFGLSHNLGVYTDELRFYGDSSFSTFYFFNNTLLPSHPMIATYWNTGYHQIYAANAVYAGVQGSAQISGENVNRLQGEALFVRALLHFYLANLFGDIPYITSTDHTVNSMAGREPIEEVYAHILTDLENAASLLPENYVANGRARPNRYTAIALMARVYLYENSWNEAENMATQVLNNSALYADENNLQKIFKKDCTETIWQLPPAMEGHSTREAETFTIFSGPPALSAFTESFVSSFSEDDLRKSAWIGQISDGTNTWYYPKKYQQTGTEPVSTEYSIILRKAEFYLIRAEARVQKGNLEGAKEDLNKIRIRSGLSETTAMSPQEIMDALFEERKLELFTEQGHRFFDLKRLHKLDEVLTPLKPGWNTNDKLFPLPESELSSNPNLHPQNPGY
ncbi:MAG TPA: RagB/SusD family nutrient uptake outer membrane protein [Moheibacter sp.]|nr:RagB/SusD family nutrient uptake outer membrane protein [Moheibacter sp.]